MYALRFDGLFREVPGKSKGEAKAGFMCYGWLIFNGDRLVAKGHGAFAHDQDATSNVAEYLALIEGMEALLDFGALDEAIEISGDAKCVIDQMQGLAKVNSTRLKPLYRRARKLAGRWPEVQWTWMPRRFNREADALTRRAMKQVRADPENYAATLETIGSPHSQRKTKLLPLLDLRIYLGGAATRTLPG